MYKYTLKWNAYTVYQNIIYQIEIKRISKNNLSMYLKRNKQFHILSLYYLSVIDSERRPSRN